MDLINQLLELVELHQTGNLSDEEYASAKNNLLQDMTALRDEGIGGEDGQKQERLTPRRRIAKGVTKARGGLKRILRRTGIEEKGKEAIEKTVTVGKESLAKIGREVDKGYRTVTLHTYRERVDQAFAEVVEVLSAHEAEILALQKKLETLENKEQES